MLGEGLFSLLSNSAAMQALLGTPSTRSDKTTGIFPVFMPEATPLPAIVISDVAGGAPAASFDGANAMHTVRVQFSCYGRSAAEAKKLATVFRRTFEGFRGQLSDAVGSPPTGGTWVFTMLFVTELDSFEEAPFLYHHPADYEIWYADVGA